MRNTEIPNVNHVANHLIMHIRHHLQKQILQKILEQAPVPDSPDSMEYENKMSLKFYHEFVLVHDHYYIMVLE